MKVYKFKVNGTGYEVTIDSMDDNNAEVTVNGTSFSVELEDTGRSKPKKVIKQISPDPAAVAAAAAKPQPNIGKPATDSAATPVKSPLPGVILDISVKVGQSVKVGDRLLVLEAMKMENNIDTFKAGVIKSINVQKGDSVLEGDLLLTIE